MCTLQIYMVVQMTEDYERDIFTLVANLCLRISSRHYFQFLLALKEEFFLRMLRQLSFMSSCSSTKDKQNSLWSRFALKCSYLVKCLTLPWGKMLALRCTWSREQWESSLSSPGHLKTEVHVNGVPRALYLAFLSYVFLFFSLPPSLPSFLPFYLMSLIKFAHIK